MRKYNHIAVLKGGWSAEREVSLASGKACGSALERAGYQVTQIDVTPTIAEDLAKLKPDAVFNALHGKWGEDGCMQGVLETLKIPYSHSGVLASSLAMNKPASKHAYRRVGIAVAEDVTVTRREAAEGKVMAPPYVLKPVNEGSSVGIYIIMEDGCSSLTQFAEEGHPDDEIMVEKFVPGRELTCAVMGETVLGCTEIVPAVGFYDYKAKYSAGGSHHVVPAEISKDMYEQVMDYSLKAHKVLGCRGVSRSDFRFDENDSGEQLYILETNTQPGMTETSLLPELAEYAGISFEDLVSWIVEDASCER